VLTARDRKVGRDRVQLGMRVGSQAALEALLELGAVEPPRNVLLPQDLYHELAVRVAGAHLPRPARCHLGQTTNPRKR
jgi:hypothetical protein